MASRLNFIRYWKGVKLASERRKCPMCRRWHRWPTVDKLCRHCEGVWVEMTGGT